jgi:hypothetical protein
VGRSRIVVSIRSRRPGDQVDSPPGHAGRVRQWPVEEETRGAHPPARSRGAAARRRCTCDGPRASAMPRSRQLGDPSSPARRTPQAGGTSRWLWPVRARVDDRLPEDDARDRPSLSGERTTSKPAAGPSRARDRRW